MIIELHGFDVTSEPFVGVNIREQFWKILKRKKKKKILDEASVSIFNDYVSNSEGKLTPFIRICSDDSADFSKVVELLRLVDIFKKYPLPIYVDCIIRDEIYIINKFPTK